MGGPCSSSPISLAHTTPTIPFSFFSFTILFLFFSSYIRSTLRHFRKKERKKWLLLLLVSCVRAHCVVVVNAQNADGGEGGGGGKLKRGAQTLFFLLFQPSNFNAPPFFAKKRKKRIRKSSELDFGAKKRGKRRKTHITFRSAPPAGRTVGRSQRHSLQHSEFSFFFCNKK